LEERRGIGIETFYRGLSAGSTIFFAAAGFVRGIITYSRLTHADDSSESAQATTPSFTIARTLIDKIAPDSHRMVFFLSTHAAFFA